MATSDRRIHAEHDSDTKHHPTEKTYIQIAIILAIITAVEVAIYYIPPLENVLVPALIAFSALKFLLVIGYFMHLKDDNKMLGAIFIAALVGSMAVFIGLGIMQNFHAVEQFVGYLTGR